jgi:hypothetical protein
MEFLELPVYVQVLRSYLKSKSFVCLENYKSLAHNKTMRMCITHNDFYREIWTIVVRSKQRSFDRLVGGTTKLQYLKMKLLEARCIGENHRF